MTIQSGEPGEHLNLKNVRVEPVINEQWFNTEMVNSTFTLTVSDIGRMDKLVFIPETEHAAPLNVAPLYNTPDTESLLQVVINTILGRSWS